MFAAVVSVLPALTDAFPSQGGMGTQLPLGGLTMLNVGGSFINVAVPASVGQVARQHPLRREVRRVDGDRLEWRAGWDYRSVLSCSEATVDSR